jgi:hypothetical protein
MRVTGLGDSFFGYAAAFGMEWYVTSEKKAAGRLDSTDGLCGPASGECSEVNAGLS